MACAPSPIALPIGNVSLPNGLVARGVALSVGQPPQPVALMPALPENNTLLYGTDGFCLTDSPGPGPWTDAACTTFRGGAYDTLASTTRTAANASSSSSDVGSDAGSVQTTAFADTLHLTSNVSLAAFSLGLALSNPGDQSDEYFPQVALGLGPRSTLLARLWQSGQIASRSWAYFLGSDSPRADAAPLNGSLVFGGYDRAKVAGTGYAWPLAPVTDACSSQLAVNITNLELDFPNSTTASLFPNRSVVLPACLRPGLAALARLPLDPYVATLLSQTDTSIGALDRSLGVYYWNLRYAAGADTYAGALTITLQNGPSIRIPNEQLVVPHVAINQTTGVVTANATAPDLLIDSLQADEASGMTQLGRQFFAAAYLLVNQDAGDFTLWAANPTAREDLVAVDTEGNEVDVLCASTSSTSSTSSASTNATVTEAAATVSTSAASTATAASLSVGTTAAVVVGAVVALAAIAALVVWCIRRRRPRRPARSPPFITMDSTSSVDKKDDRFQPHEVSGRELPVIYQYELQG